MTRAPVLTTSRLIVRPFSMDDLEAIQRILDVELADADLGSEGAGTLEQRAEWLQWTVRNYEQLARLYQPPYGDRAVELTATGEVIGTCGFVPSFGPFHRLPSCAAGASPAEAQLNAPEMGLFYAVSPRHQRRGYAAEAAGALIDYAFRHLRLRRIVATTTYDNAASIAVMRRLGMRVERNPLAEPEWFQAVGVLANGSLVARPATSD